MTLKLRISLSQPRDEIKGTIELPRDGAFVLECLDMVVRQFAQIQGLSPSEVAADLYRLSKEER